MITIGFPVTVLGCRSTSMRRTVHHAPAMVLRLLAFAADTPRSSSSAGRPAAASGPRPFT